MGLLTLPYELKHKIADFLDTKSLLRLIESGQGELDNNFIWKEKCQNEYYFYSDRIKNWKEKYKKLYLTKCIHCHKNTKLYNDFYKVKVCRKCEIDNTKYHTISHTKAKKFYLLTEAELSGLHFIYRLNPYNYTQKLKLYLKDDILKCITSPEGRYIQTIQQRLDIRRMYHINRVTKFNIILTTLVTVYSVTASNLIIILSNLNMYSKGMYEKFMRYNNRSPLPVINKALELDFIFTYTRIVLYNSYNSFEELLLHYLLTNVITLLPMHINGHIDWCIKKCVENHRELFIRKGEVMRLYNELRSRLTVSNVLKISAIQRYIQSGYIMPLGEHDKDTRTQLKNHILLHDFLYINTDVQAILFEYNLLGKLMDKYSLYITLLNKWYFRNPELRYKLPNELYSLLSN